MPALEDEMKTWYFTNAAKLTFQSKYPSKIIIGARSLDEAKKKLKEYIKIGVRLGWYVDVST
jgi:hypothetical protein